MPSLLNCSHGIHPPKKLHMRLLQMILYGSEEGAYLNEGLLVLTVAFREIGEGCGGMVTGVVDTYWLVCCSNMVLKLWLVFEGAWEKLAAPEKPES